MTLSTPQRRPRSGWKMTISASWTGPHNLQTSILLNTYGNISNQNSPSIQHSQKGIGKFGREWQRCGTIRPEVCQNLIESMPRRVQAVIKAKGGDTKPKN